MPGSPEGLSPGQLVGAKRYRIERVLGQGSQGQTLEAIDSGNGTHVAIKRFRVRGAESWKDVELAEREATVLAQLDHPALPRHLDHFEEDGALYLVMSLIEGESLEALRRGGERFDSEELLALLEQIGDVLRYLAEQGPPVVHRDIKPGNIIRRPDGSFALVDFGSVGDHLKPDGSTVTGTYGYMAPEQFQGRAMPVSDIYGLGATALTLLTGVEPEDQPHRGLGIDVAKALHRKANDAWVRLLRQMLEPNPDERLRDLRAKLQAFSEAQASEDGAIAPRQRPPKRQPEDRSSPSRKTAHRTRRLRTTEPALDSKRTPAAGCGALVMLIVVINVVTVVFAAFPVAAISGTVALITLVVFFVAVSGSSKRAKTRPAGPAGTRSQRIRIGAAGEDAEVRESVEEAASSAKKQARAG